MNQEQIKRIRRHIHHALRGQDRQCCVLYIKNYDTWLQIKNKSLLSFMYTSGNHINILENREIMSQSLNQMSHIQSGGEWESKIQYEEQKLVKIFIPYP